MKEIKDKGLILFSAAVLFRRLAFRMGGKR